MMYNVYCVVHYMYISLNRIDDTKQTHTRTHSTYSMCNFNKSFKLHLKVKKIVFNQVFQISHK